jgi:hypothetical protein
MNGDKKVSKMILDVAAQFIELVGSEEERQTNLDIACMAWNISILPEDEREVEYSKYFSKMSRQLKDSEVIRYFEMDLNGLIDAKLDLYPNVKKPIVSAKLENISLGKYQVTASFPITKRYDA